MHILLMYTPDPPSAAHIRRLESLDPKIQISVASSEGDALEKAATAEVILGHRYLRQVLPHAPHLRWVQSTSGGTDYLPEMALAERNITLTRFTGASTIIAQHARALAWALTRAVPSLVQQQMNGTWNKVLPFLPRPRRALILGTGSIGRALARSLHADGLHVSGVKRRVVRYRPSTYSTTRLPGGRPCRNRTGASSRFRERPTPSTWWMRMPSALFPRTPFWSMLDAAKRSITQPSFV